MRNSTKVIFENELNKVKAIREDKTKTRREYDKAMFALMEIINSYETAEELEYSDEIKNKIRNARNGIEAQNILTDARRAS